MDSGGELRDTPNYTETSGTPFDGVLTITPDFEISSCNSAVDTLLRANVSDTVGASLWDLIPDAVGTIAQTKIEAAFTSGQQQSFERYDPASDTRVDVRVYPDGDELTLVVSELRRGGDRQQDAYPFKPTEEPVGVGGWKIDLPSETLHVSEEVLRIRGLPPDYSLSLEEGLRFYHPEDRELMRAAVERLKTEGETYDLELREVTDDGELYWVRTTGVADYDENGEITALRGVYRDITERKENELELQRQTREIRRQNERLDEFASVVSHDLRNPLNVAQGRLELARAEVANDHLDAIETAHARMETLIEDLLDLARYGREVRDPRPVDVAAVVERCWETVDTGSARLELRTDATILSDEAQLLQLLGNLVRNAIEHGGDDVTVSVGALDDGFYFDDDGPGIPEERRENVFQVGYSTSPTGTGLGLTIVKEIADAHHWQVRIVDNPDQGTRFAFTGVTRV